MNGALKTGFKRYLEFPDTIQGRLDELAFQMILVEQYHEGLIEGWEQSFQMVREYLDEVTHCLTKKKNKR